MVVDCQVVTCGIVHILLFWPHSQVSFQGDPCACRGSLALQCSTLLLLDIVYAGMHRKGIQHYVQSPERFSPRTQHMLVMLHEGMQVGMQVSTHRVTYPVFIYVTGLHLQPLLPLFQIGSSPDVAFMHSYTKAAYFVSECLLLGWLLSNGVIRSEPGSLSGITCTLYTCCSALCHMRVQARNCPTAWPLSSISSLDEQCHLASFVNSCSVTHVAALWLSCIIDH